MEIKIIDELRSVVCASHISSEMQINLVIRVDE